MTAPIETITVRWCGKDVSATLRPVAPGCLPEAIISGARRVNEVRLFFDADEERPWRAVAFGGPCACLSSRGLTAQAALDKLAAQLREIARWATAALGEAP